MTDTANDYQTSDNETKPGKRQSSRLPLGLFC